MKLIAALMLMLSTSVSWAGFDEAMSALDKKDYQTTIANLEAVSGDENDPYYLDAQQLMGWMYIEGLGFPIDKEEGFFWINRAAFKGHVPSMRDLGKLYVAGIGIAANYQEGHDWMKKAADKSDPEAITLLARMDALYPIREKVKPVKADEPSDIALRWALMNKIRRESFGDSPNVFVTSVEKTKGGCKRVNDTAFLCNLKLGTKVIGQQSRVNVIQARLEFDAGRWYVAYLN